MIAIRANNKNLHTPGRETHRTSHERYLESTQITMANKIITDHPNEMQQEKARQRKHSIDRIYEYQPVFQLHRPSCREPTQLSFVFQ